MELLAAIFALALAVWGIVVWKLRPPLPANTMVWLGLASYFASVVVGYDFFHKDFGPLPLTIDRALLGLAWGCWIYDWLFYRRSLPRLEPLDWCLAAWLILTAINTFTSDYGFRDNAPISRLLFFNIIPVATYFALRFQRVTSVQQQSMLWALVLLGIYLGATGVAEWKRWYGLVYPRYIASPEFEEFYGRGRGPLLNPVINGILLSLSGAACLLLLPLTRKRYWPLLLGSFGVVGLGVLSTLTRSCWMGFAASSFLICLAPLNWRQRILATLAVSLVGIIGLTALSSQLNRFKRDENVSVEDMSQSASLRPVLAFVAWEMFQDYPVMGVGFGQYNKYKKPYHQVEGYDQPLQMALPYVQHNVMLSYATELGALGLGLAGLLWCLLAWQAIRIWCDPEASLKLRCLGLLLLAALINYLINGLFHDVSVIPVANASLLVPAALATRQVALANERSPRPLDESPLSPLPVPRPL